MKCYSIIHFGRKQIQNSPEHTISFLYRGDLYDVNVTVDINSAQGTCPPIKEIEIYL